MVRGALRFREIAMADQPFDMDTQADDEPQSVAVPPHITAEKWEGFPCFRESFLVYFTESNSNEALRFVGNLLYDMVLQYWEHWPKHPEGWVPSFVRAALADLRHLEGLLAAFGHESPDAGTRDARLCLRAVEASVAIRAVADRLETELGPGPEGEPVQIRNEKRGNA
jgi:hypothetical protein